MHTMYFTERPYRYVPNDEVIKNGRGYSVRIGEEILL